jgi:hypothetical protein
MIFEFAQKSFPSQYLLPFYLDLPQCDLYAEQAVIKGSVDKGV